MNFLVSANRTTVQQFKEALLEQGDAICVENFAGLLTRADRTGAGLAVIDAMAPGFAGEDALRQLKRVNPALRILLVSSNLPPQQELAALAAGAMGCCDADLGVDQVRRILTVIEDGGVWISNAALPHLLRRLHALTDHAVTVDPPAPVADPGLNGLTQREREIAQMVASGESNKIIARQLNITERTVKSHLTTIFQKLHMHDRLQLALFINRVPQ